MTSPIVTLYPPAVPTVGLPPDEVIDALLSGVVDIKRRAEIYESDGVTPFDITDWDSRLVDGQITVDMNRDERRMCDLTFQNNDLALNLDPVDGFWYDKIIKCFWGIEYYSPSPSVIANEFIRWEMQVGEFMIDTITEEYFPNTTKITGRDYTKKCLVSEIVNSLQFSNTNTVEQIVRALAANSGITKFRLPYTGLAFTDTVVFEPGTARWEIMKKLCDSIGFEVYFTSDGYLTMRPYQDPATSPLTWIFRTGQPDGTLITYKRSSDDSLVKNHCIVIGSSKSSESGFNRIAFGEARNDDLSSPTNIARIGDRVDTFKSDYISDANQAQTLAEQRLRISALEQYSIDFSSIILPFIDAGDIVHIENEKETNYVPARFLLSNYTLPMMLGEMSGVGRRVTIVGTKRKFGVY